MILPEIDFERDLLLAFRYSYYCLHQNIIPDADYDAREQEYHRTHPRLPVGSDLKEEYSPAVRALAMYFLFSRGPAPEPVRHPVPRKKPAPQPSGEELL